MESCRVHKVLACENGRGQISKRVITRSLRIPQVGDKFSSRHGQKGTIGYIFPAEDMPFNKDGISPDLIINPHAFPSRMTIGQIIECISGKIAAKTGNIADGTAFQEHKPTVDELCNKMKECGYEPQGKEILYNGMTGERIEAEIFMGPVFYQRLKHMVIDKLHSRRRGPSTMLTHQPVEGRSRGGGFRVGEMERDAMIAHGVSKIIQDRFMKASDEFITYICKTCGNIAQDRSDTNYGDSVIKNKPYCKVCNDYNVVAVQVPYVAKLLAQESSSLHMHMRLRVNEEFICTNTNTNPGK